MWTWTPAYVYERSVVPVPWFTGWPNSNVNTHVIGYCDYYSNAACIEDVLRYKTPIAKNRALVKIIHEKNTWFTLLPSQFVIVFVEKKNIKEWKDVCTRIFFSSLDQIKKVGIVWGEKEKICYCASLLFAKVWLWWIRLDSEILLKFPAMQQFARCCFQVAFYRST